MITISNRDLHVLFKDDVILPLISFMQGHFGYVHVGLLISFDVNVNKRYVSRLVLGLYVTL